MSQLAQHFFFYYLRRKNTVCRDKTKQKSTCNGVCFFTFPCKFSRSTVCLLHVFVIDTINIEKIHLFTKNLSLSQLENTGQFKCNQESDDQITDSEVRII